MGCSSIQATRWSAMASKLRPMPPSLPSAEGDGHHGFDVRGVRRLAGVVAAAGERAGLDVVDAHGLADALELGELLGRDPPGHREVVGGGPQVLADGDDVDPDAPEIGEHADELVEGLAHADDDAALGGEPGGL